MEVAGAIWILPQFASTAERRRRGLPVSPARGHTKKRALQGRSGVGRRGEGAQGFGVGGEGDAALSENGGDVTVRSDVEGGMRGGNVRRNTHALNLRDFGGGALLDGNVLAIGNGEIEGGDRRSNVERHVVFASENGDLIGADFVGGVAVGGDAIRAGDDGADFAGFQEVSDHVVRDEREGNAAAVELPGGEARALKIGARFRNEDVQLLALLDGNLDDAESGADAAGGEGAGVALSHDPAFAGK